VGAVWEPNNEIRVQALTEAEADDLNLLAVKRMGGMSNGDD
jgi:hypothetical protein